MLKTIQKRMTVILIVSMLLLLFVGVSPVLADDSSDLIAEPEFVPMLAVTLSPGETAGATSATVTDNVYGNLLVNVTEEEIARPQVGEVAPTAGDNMIADYESGADITAGVAAGNYLQIYDVDMEEGARIAAFYQVGLTGEDIKEEDNKEEADEHIGEGAEEEPAESQLMGAELMAEGGYTYIDENGEIKKTGTKAVTKITSDTATLNEGWHIVEGNINRTGAITVNGNVHLILADGSSLTVNVFHNAGINVSENNSLTIYAQSKGNEMGSLNAKGFVGSAGIGGAQGTYPGDNTGTVSNGVITINGGRITARGGHGGAGIGGGREGNGGNITINDGIVIATGGKVGAGIGGGDCGDSGNVTINNGKVTATGGFFAAGIGSGFQGSYTGEITINGGIVTSIGGRRGAGIGSGYNGNGGTIIINNHPTVISTGKEGAADIGNGTNGTGITNIKQDSIGGTDLTYVRLELQNLSPENEHKIIFNEQEHVINSEGITGFFVEKSTESISISLESAGPLISIDPGDVQNSRITVNASYYYYKPVAGFGSALDFPANLQSRINVPFEYTKIRGKSNFTISMWISPRENEPYQTIYRQEGDGKGTLGLDFRFIKYNDD